MPKSLLQFSKRYQRVNNILRYSVRAYTRESELPGESQFQSPNVLSGHLASV